MQGVKARWGRILVVWVAMGAIVWGLTTLMGCDTATAGELMTKDELNGHMGPYFNRVVDAIYIAEGGAKAKKPFGILSVPCSDYEDCRKVAYNTVRNNYHRWIAGGRKGEYLAFLANRYCPVGADNDPGGLNKHWLGNVTRLVESGL
jgi:hypothetical protein